MNCPEIQNLWGLFHDQELDQAQAGQIQEHLRRCPQCQQFYQAQSQFDSALTSALRQGSRHQALWQSEEAAIRKLLDNTSSVAKPVTSARESLRERTVLSWSRRFPFGPRYYAALASIWILLLTINYSLKSRTMVALPDGPSAPVSSTFHDYRRELLLELAITENPDEKPAVHPPPRSDRSYHDRNKA